MLTAEEEQAHISLWYMLAEPLIAGDDLRKTSKQTNVLLTNKEAITIDEDASAIQGYKILDKEEYGYLLF